MKKIAIIMSEEPIANSDVALYEDGFVSISNISSLSSSSQENHSTPGNLFNPMDKLNPNGFLSKINSFGSKDKLLTSFTEKHEPSKGHMDIKSKLTTDLQCLEMLTPSPKPSASKRRQDMPSARSISSKRLKF